MSHKRQRATVLVVRDGRYLLVKDKGSIFYALPGGGIHQGEGVLMAARREIDEELGLKADRADHIFDYDCLECVNSHKVVLVSTDGEPRVNQRELESLRWWDGKESLQMYPHVSGIVARYEAEKLSPPG